MRCSVHSRMTLPPPFGRRAARLADPVPSSWFCTTSTACSAAKLRACCIPLPTMGFVSFPGFRFQTAEAVGERGPFPATHVPLEELPSSAAAPCHHGRCPLVVTPVPPDVRSPEHPLFPAEAGTRNRRCICRSRRAPGRLPCESHISRKRRTAQTDYARPKSRRVEPRSHPKTRCPHLSDPRPLRASWGFRVPRSACWEASVL